MINQVIDKPHGVVPSEEEYADFLSTISDHSTDSIRRGTVYIADVPTVQNKIKMLLAELQEFLADIDFQPDLAIHGIRKRTKYIRALLAIDPGASTDLRTSMKSISNILAPYRDARVNRDTFQAITTLNSSLTDPGIAARLDQNPFLVKRLPVSTELELIKRLLADFTAQLGSHTRAIPPSQILQSIETTFHSGKKGLKRVEREPNIRTVHAWRKKTKPLWYQLRFLFGDELNDPDHPLALSNVLGKRLGEIHDLDVLMELLDLDQNHPFILHASKLRQAQLTRSLNIGHTLYAPQHSNFLQTIQQELTDTHGS